MRTLKFNSANTQLLITALLLLLPNPVFALQGLITLPKEFKPKAETQLQVLNMPRVRSQDSVGFCYSFVSATLYDEANCVSRKIADCSSASDDQKASPVDISRYAQAAEKGSDNSDRFNYQGLKIDGSGPGFTLENALRAGAIAKESCAPFDQLVSNLEDTKKAQEMEIAIWKRFEDAYKTYQKKSTICANCGLEYATAVSSQLKEEFNLKATNTEILEAFSKDSYKKFLDGLLVPQECGDIKNSISLKGDWRLKLFPEVNKKASYNDYISKIKELLTKKRPFGIDFCTQTPLKAKKSAECGVVTNGKLTSGQGHTVVIKGYRKVCNEKNECRESLQVQNSWGQSWQNSNDDGWVDAKELISRTFYESQTMTWLEQEN